MDFRQIALSGLIQSHPAKLHLTAWRLDLPSNAIASRVHTIAVRWLGRMLVRPVSRTQPLSNDIFETSRNPGCFETLAFCHSLNGESTKLSVTDKVPGTPRGDAAICNFAARTTAPNCSLRPKNPCKERLSSRCRVEKLGVLVWCHANGSRMQSSNIAASCLINRRQVWNLGDHRISEV